MIVKKAIEYIRIREEVYEKIRLSILDRGISTGYIFIVEEEAKNLCVRRVFVREALRMLENEGKVTFEGRKSVLT